MLGKALGLVPVADGSGPEFDTGELTTWLDDGVLLAPGMLLGPRTTWEAAGPHGFRVAVTDAGRTERAEVSLDEDDRPSDVRSDDRRADLPGGPVRALWSTPVDGWAVVDGRPRIGMERRSGTWPTGVPLCRDAPGRPRAGRCPPCRDGPAPAIPDRRSAPRATFRS
jgi:hypothetical protein